MPLREDQIVRYGRQILLRELGGRGQERLLTSPVRVIGSGPAIDDAVAWLLAGGTPVELIGAPPGGFLTGVALDPVGLAPVAELVLRGQSFTQRAVVVMGAGVAWRTPSACDECWETVLSGLGPEPLGPVGSLAALTVQRLVLGWADPLGIVHGRASRFETGRILPCPHPRKDQQ